MKQLPEEFSVYAKTLEEAKYITQKQRELCGGYNVVRPNEYYRLSPNKLCKYGNMNSSYLNGNLEISKEFTFEEFKSYFENMETKKIIGYKLLKSEYAEAACKIAKLSGTTKKCLEETIKKNMPYYHTVGLLNKAGVLDLWFEPLYEEEKQLPDINGYKGKLEGDYITYGSNCAKFHKSFFNILWREFDKTSSVSGFLQQNRTIKSIKLDSGVEITMEQVKQIVEFLNK